MQIDRRLFLVAGSAGLVLGIAGCGPRNATGSARDPGALNMWLAIAPDGIVTLRVNATDIGQGAQTGLAQIVADELDADWPQMRVEMAPVTDRYMVKEGSYYTGGSSSIREQFEIFAQAGATARAMLMAAAAKRWSVDVATCTARNGKVLHAASNKSLSYGELSREAAGLDLPVNVALKTASARKLIGRPMARLDIPDKVSGRAIYGIDVKLPGMLIAAIRQCPMFGGRLQSVSKAPAMAIKGVRKVVTFDNAAAVIAEKFWVAKKGLAALAPVWTAPPDAIPSDDAMFIRLKSEIGARDSIVVTLDKATQDATVARVDTALKGPNIFQADYRLPLLAHAPMEPMNAAAHVTNDGCELWVPTQNQGGMRDDVAKALGIPKSSIVLHTTKVGGGFGRRLQTDYGVFAARIAKDVGRPVKLIWTREEDFTHDFYRPASACRLRAAVNDDKTIKALDYTGATANDTAIGGFAGNYPGIDVVVRQKKTKFPLPIGPWRSVDPSITIFFLESFIDEIAHASAIDPLEYRRLLLKGKMRALRVLDTVAKMANWGHPPPGRAQGLAFFTSDYWLTTVAEVVELSVDGTNKITLHRVFCAVDPGLAVNPDQVAAQAEGGILMGLSAALGEAITINGGRVEQTNFDTYTVPRLRSMPDVTVQVLQTDGAPAGGVGEPPVPPAAPALANALFAATGKRVRALPLSQSGFTV